jgi:anti-sigma regulatory factor (Ser/Thr protein kinase)/putative methionine-R-sulfoxide reductase with GAF domain
VEHGARDRKSSLGRGQVLLGSASEGALSPAPERAANLYRLSDPILSDLGLDALLRELLLRIREILEVDTAAILLLDEETAELVPRAADGLEEEVERGIRVPLGEGFAGRVAAERAAIAIFNLGDADIVNPILRERGIRALLGVPLVVEGAVIGVLHVGSLVPRDFGTADAVVLELAAARAAPAIERARLFAALEGEHRGAVALQRSLLPARLPDLADATVAARYLPARDEVGGDWYDVVTLPMGRIGLAIGDVAGHGVRAAALMGQMRAALRAYALENHSPAVVLELLDRMLRATRERAMATVIYAVIEPETGRVTYASAGHPPPVLVRAAEARLIQPATGPPVGVVADSLYDEAEIELHPGETLLLYTDGLVEVRGEALDRGLERLVGAARGITAPHALCERILEALVPSGGGSDDIAVVALHNPPVPQVLDLRLPAEPQTLATLRHTLRRWLRAAGATVDDLAAITLACSEAAANAVEHAYGAGPAMYEVTARVEESVVVLSVSDRGRWRGSRGENRGHGHVIMRAAMDEVEVRPGEAGTAVLMRRRLGSAA